MTIVRKPRQVSAVLAASATVLSLTACSVGAGSQGGGDGGSYPDGPIEFVVPYSAGGASDQLARTIAPELESNLGESVVVRNETGGAGTVGMTSVMNAEPDGYRLGFTAGGPLTVQPHYGRTTYSLDDVTPVAQVAKAPLLLAVREDAPWKNLDDLVKDLKSGETDFKYASTGTGNPANIAMEKLNAAAGIETKQVPFESSGEATSALLGGNVDAAASVPSAFAPSVEAGDLRIIANLGDVKNSFYKDVPTLADAGYKAATNVPIGIVAPPGIDPNVVETLADATKTAVEAPEIEKQINATGFVPTFAEGTEYGKDLETEYKETGKILEELGLLDD